MTATTATPLPPRRANLVLATLFAGMFVLGSAELLVVGVLDVIADDLGVSIPAAGTLVTAYALGLALGGPVLTALTIRVDRRTVLAGSLALFALGNVAAVVTASYTVFLAARVVTGAVQGVFIAAAFGAAVSVVPPERMGRAIAVIISGVSVSAALGVPLGTLVGQALGWRGSFVAIVALATLALLAAVAVVPSLPSSGGGAGDQARHAFAPRVLAVLLLMVLAFGAVYAALTYLVPFLEEVTGISGVAVSAYLLAFGVAAAVGSFGGGRFADADAARTITVATAGLALSLLALLLVGEVAVLVALALLASGVLAFGMVPSLQYRVVTLAGPGAALAQSLPASAANIGIAFGSFAGGVAIRGLSVEAAVVTAVVIAALAVPVAWATRLLQPPAVEAPAEDEPAPGLV